MKVDVLSYLETLLYHNDEVEIPSLGKISTRQNDFSIDRGEGVFYPSAKRVHSFDKIIHTNNSTLINFIAQKHGMSYDEALRIVQDFSDEYASVLKTKGFNIPSIGHLMMDEEERILFKPNVKQNYAIENYGLPILKNIHPVAADRTQIKIAEQFTPNRNIVVKQPKTYAEIFVDNRYLQLMAVIVLLLIVSIPVTKQYNDSQNRANAGVLNTNSEDSNRTNTNDYDKDLDDESGFEEVTPNRKNEPKTIPIAPPKTEEKPKVIAPKVEQPKTEQPKVEQPKTEENQPTSNETQLFVIGAFGSKANAEKLQIEIYSKGYKNADVTETSSGLYRVGIILDIPEKEVNAELLKIKKIYPKAWWQRGK